MTKKTVSHRKNQILQKTKNANSKINFPQRLIDSSIQRRQISHLFLYICHTVGLQILSVTILKNETSRYGSLEMTNDDMAASA